MRAWIGGLDGLRALAVIAVVVFHLNPDYLPGGFLGVDLFFVISGYLITRLLLAERASTGRIALGSFYLRRARRLLPAVALLLGIVTVCGSLLWPDQRPTLPGSAWSSATYVTNWWMIADQQSYFVTSGRPPMLQHLWSLAIEEQYYLLWAPAVMLLAALVVGRARRPGATTAGGNAAREAVAKATSNSAIAVAVATVAAALAVASTVAMVILAVRHNVPYQTDSSRVYFGTDTHAMGLLLGSAFGALVSLPWRAAATGRVSRRLRASAPVAVTDCVAFAGLVAVAWFTLHVDEFQPWLFRGGFLAFAGVAGLTVVAAGRAGSRIGRLLDIAPLRWLGRRSYGIYLWHWPVTVVTRPGIDIDWPAWVLDPLRAGLAVALAAASYRFVELPIRRGTLTSWRPATPHQSRLRAVLVTALMVTSLAIATAAAGRQPATESAHETAASSSGTGSAHAPLLTMPHPGSPAPGAADRWVSMVTGTSTSARTTHGLAVPVGPLPSQTREPVRQAARYAAAQPAPSAAESTAGATGTPESASVPEGLVAAAGQSATEPTSGEDAPASVGRGTPVGGDTRAGSRGGTPADAGADAPAGTSVSPGAPTDASASAAPSPVAPPSAAGEPASTPAPSAPAPAPAHPTTATVAVSAFGDSVLLGAAEAIRADLGSMSLDAVVGRQAWDTLAALDEARRRGTLSPVVLIHTGNNGVISPKQLDATLATLADRSRVIVVNDHVDRAWQGPNNEVIASVAKKYSNVAVVDWHAAADANPTWLGADGIHVNGSGAKGYAALVAAAIVK